MKRGLEGSTPKGKIKWGSEPGVESTCDQGIQAPMRSILATSSSTKSDRWDSTGWFPTLYGGGVSDLKDDGTLQPFAGPHSKDPSNGCKNSSTVTPSVIHRRIRDLLFSGRRGKSIRSQKSDDSFKEPGTKSSGFRTLGFLPIVIANLASSTRPKSKPYKREVRNFSAREKGGREGSKFEILYFKIDFLQPERVTHLSLFPLSG